MNIADWIENWARATPDKIALRFEGTELTYPRFNEDINAWARMLHSELRITVGDRVAYLGQNHPNLLTLLFACARLGAIFVPLNWRLVPHEHRHMVRDCGAAALFVDAPYAMPCEEFRSELPDCVFVSVSDHETVDWPRVSELLGNAQGVSRGVGARAIGLDSPLLIIYTSGTTGFPKGAVLKQEAIQTNAFNSLLLHGMTSEDVILSALPMFHVGGLNVLTTTALYVGATVIVHRTFDPQRVLECLTKDKPTQANLLPAHSQALRKLPGMEEAVIHLRALSTGSCSIPDEMVHYWHDRGVPVVNVYGASETGPVAIHQSVSNALTTRGTIGYPAMHCEARIVDPGGDDCPPGREGEILIRGRNVMSHYWNNESATRAALVDGWFHTGDIGVVDERGCFRIVDRKKDLIISGGENIYPAELENVLSSHPDVEEAAVVGRSDPQWGEVPVAVIVTKAGRCLEKSAVLAWFDGKLGRYKHPKDVVFTDALPRNEMRKVVKEALRRLVINRASE